MESVLERISPHSLPAFRKVYYFQLSTLLKNQPNHAGNKAAEAAQKADMTWGSLIG